MDQQQQQMYPTISLMDPNYPSSSLAPANQFNVNEIKKYSFPDCIISYFSYFEMWTQTLNGEQKKIQLNRLLQDDEIAFSIFMQNVTDPYELIKAKLIEQLSECDESFLKDKKEKKKRKKMFRKMSKEDMQAYVRSTYNNLNGLPKERLVLNELVRLLPKKYKRLNLESKCTTVEQMIEVLGEKFNNSLKLKDPAKKKHGGHRGHRNNSSSSSSSSSDDEKSSKKKDAGHHHHEKAHHSKKHW